MILWKGINQMVLGMLGAGLVVPQESELCCGVVWLIFALL